MQTRHARSIRADYIMRSSLTFHWIASLVTAALCGASYTLVTQRESANFTRSQLERLMFADQEETARYRSNCGPEWHQLFSKWEQQQRKALMGETRVKIVVWRCEKICGGLGDRQRGILTSFALALVTNRAFFIDSQSPVPLQHYFHLASPDLHWVYREGLLTNRSILEETFMDTLPHVGDFAIANLSYYDAYDIVIQKNNFWKPLSILQNPSWQPVKTTRMYSPHTLAGCMLNYLLSPAAELQNLVQQMKAQQLSKGREIMAIQIRSGDSQSKNSTVLDDLVTHFRSCMMNVSRMSNALFSVFLTTDSTEIEKRFQAIYPDLLAFDGPITHVDGFFGLASEPDLAFRKVVLDHIMISQSQQLIISRSGFAEFAALRGFKSYHTPPSCNRKQHYVFPNNLQAGVPATQLNSVYNILRPSFEGRGDK